MKIKYLGTAAAEGVPALFCQCDTCEKARKTGVIRSRAQAIIDDCILLDFGPDTFYHMAENGIDLGNIRKILITHAHEDHLSEWEIENLRDSCYSHPKKGEPFCFFGSNAVIQKLKIYTSRFTEHDTHPVLTEMSHAKTVEFDGYRVTSLHAKHSEDTGPLFYVISKGGKTLMYCHDTSIFPDDTWEYLEKNPFHADFISLDCTAGNDQRDSGSHMCINQNIRVRDRLKSLGIANDTTVFCLNHFSHNGFCILPDELDPIAKELGFEYSLDKKEFEF